MARVGDIVADASNAVWRLYTEALWDEVPTPILSVLRTQIQLLELRIGDVLRERGFN